MSQFLRLMAVLVCCTTASTADTLDSQRFKFQRPEFVRFPDDARYNIDVATLGKMLFFDQRLSGGQNLSCSTCHNPSFGWEAPFPLALGSDNQPLNKHSPTLLNLAWSENFYWDGRALSLEQQAIGPLTSTREMNADLEIISRRLEALEGYKRHFDRLFPDRGVSPQTIVIALATFERTIVSGQSRFDRWVMGDEQALSSVEVHGFQVFVGKGKCSSCHSGWRFTNGQKFDIGIIPDVHLANSENGDASFKVPSLRSVQLRAPYMHNGSLSSIEDVLYHYQSGGSDLERKIDIAPLSLEAGDIEALKAFLFTLTDEDQGIRVPILPAE